MKSVTQNWLEEKTVSRLAEDAFGTPARAVAELSGGMFNAAYLVTLAAPGEGVPPQVVLKVGPAPGAKVLTYEKDILRAEVEVYGLLAGRGIPIPRLLHHDFSRRLVDADYFFMGKLEGETWQALAKKLPPEGRPALMRELGRYNALTHAVQGPYFGYIKQDESFRFSTWAAAFAAMMDNIMADGRRRRLKLPYQRVSRAVARRAALLDEVQTPALVNYDMWAGNIFLAQRQGRYTVSGIVDFERAFFGDPCADFISAMQVFSDVEQEPDFCRGYEEASDAPLVITDAHRQRMALYRLYMAMLMAVETYRFNKAYAALALRHNKAQVEKQLRLLGE